MGDRQFEFEFVGILTHAHRFIPTITVGGKAKHREETYTIRIVSETRNHDLVGPAIVG